MTNPFTEAAGWDLDNMPTSDDYLPAGDHKVTIQAVDPSLTSAKGYPQLEVTVGNDKGSLRKKLTLTGHRNSIADVMRLVKAVGSPPPGDGDVAGDLRLSKAYVDQWVGKEVGIEARDEPGFSDPSKTYTNITAFVPAAGLVERVIPRTQSDFGGDTSGGWAGGSTPAPAATGWPAAATPAKQDDIPF